MAEADRLADRGGHARHPADGERRPRGRRRGGPSAARAARRWFASSPARATTAATASSARGSWPNAAIRFGCCCSAIATAQGRCGRGRPRAGRGRWRRPRPRRSQGPDLIVDALFGAGLDRPVEGPARAMIEAINAAGVPVVAVDLPSGINGDSGAVMGAAVNASANRDVLSQKARPPAAAGTAALRSGRGRRHRHPGHGAGQHPSRASSPMPPALWADRFPVPQPGGHKYRRGHAVVVSGDVSHTGAARLAARGALRAGAGLVTIASPRDALAVNAASNLAVMVRPVDGADELADMARRSAAQYHRAGAGRRGRPADARDGARGLGGRTGGGARCRRANELCRDAGNAVCRNQRPGRLTDGADPA